MANIKRQFQDLLKVSFSENVGHQTIECSQIPVGGLWSSNRVGSLRDAAAFYQRHQSKKNLKCKVSLADQSFTQKQYLLRMV